MNEEKCSLCRLVDDDAPGAPVEAIRTLAMDSALWLPHIKAAYLRVMAWLDAQEKETTSDDEAICVDNLS